jgi:hypothetical protein
MARQLFRGAPMRIGVLHRLVTALVLVGGLACGAPAWSQSPAAIEQAARDSVRSLDLQTELPLQRTTIRTLKLPIEIVWLVLICVLALLLYALRDQLAFWRSSRDRWDRSAAEAEADAAAATIDPLDAADQLSRYGRFVDAMHMLLLQSVADIRERLGVQFADSLTSREILSGAQLSPQGRKSLREIVAAVEWTYFGGYPAEMHDYAACRRSFEALRRELAGGAAA